MNLTKAEFQTARLASFGLTSKEIGKIKCVDRRTIDCQLSNVYKKLGISGKRELPRIFLDESKSSYLMAGCFKLKVLDKVRLLSNQGLKEEQISQRLKISLRCTQMHLNTINGISHNKAIECKGLKLRLKEWAKLLSTNKFELSYRLRNGEQLEQML